MTMPTIGVVDDRPGARRTLARQIRRALPSNEEWAVIEADPFTVPAYYLSWIQENQVGVLVLDERLHEGGPVGFEGSEVAAILRQRLPSFPIYIITAHTGDEELAERAAKVEDIIDRVEFTNNAAMYVERFVRAGGKFFSDRNEALQRLAQLSSMAATSSLEEPEALELSELQAKLGVPFAADVAERADWLRRLEATLHRFEDVETRWKQRSRHRDGQ